MFQKDMTVSLLLDFYGDILSEHKRGIMEMYYDEDMSLAEISEQVGISRQAVREIIKKSESELSNLENTLGLVKKFDKLKHDLDTIKNELRAASDVSGKDSKGIIDRVIVEIDGLDI
ncbi:MAG: winged helix-turn-helix transcriptional regulator [Clostridia bacterium]|nr:winged helix-turn-helix transcriptional regulator [Clostridia bacterium]